MSFGLLGYTENNSRSIPLLLDTYDGAYFAYSIGRQLKSSQTKALRLRRSSDNAEQDIGFVNGVYDTASHSSFKGASTVYAVRLYDATGNGHDAYQSVAGQQAEVQLSVQNGLPSLNLTGSQQYNILSVSFTGQNPNISLFSVFQPGDTTNNKDLLSFTYAPHTASEPYITWRFASTSKVNIHKRFGLANNFGNGSCTSTDKNVISAPSYTSQFYLMDNHIISGVDNLNLDNTAFHSSADLSGDCTPLYNEGSLLSFKAYLVDSGTAFFIGKFSEMIFYLSDQSSNATSIKTNINNIWNVI